MNVAAISSDNENSENSNNSEQTTNYNKKKITKSQITHEAEINEEIQNMRSIIIQKKVFCTLFRLFRFKLKFM